MSFYRQLYNILRILWQTIAWGTLFALPVLTGILYKPNRLNVVKHKINYCWLLMYYAAASIWVALFYINTLLFIPRVNTAKNMFRYFYQQLVFVFLQLSAFALLLAACAKNCSNQGVLSNPVAIAYTGMVIMLATIFYQLVKAGKYITGYACETIIESNYLKAGLARQQSNVKPYFFTADLKGMNTLAKKKIG